MPHQRAVKLYDRLHSDGPRLVSTEETVYLPGEDLPDEAIPWQQCHVADQWAITEDGGACRVLRVVSRGKLGRFLVTACGEAGIDRDGWPLVSTGSPSHYRFIYTKFDDVDGRQIPTKLKQFVDLMFQTSDPILAWRIAHPYRTRWARREEQFPEQLRKERRRDRDRFRDALKREDVQWYMNHTLRDEMKDRKLSRAALLTRMEKLIQDEKTPAEVVRKSCMALLAVWEDAVESKSPDESIETPPRVVDLEGKVEDIKEIRARRDRLRKTRQQETGTG